MERVMAADDAKSEQQVEASVALEPRINPNGKAQGTARLCYYN